nr:MAG TPA: hypothetical protein [Caudoviricetes sp.]
MSYAQRFIRASVRKNRRSLAFPSTISKTIWKNTPKQTG